MKQLPGFLKETLSGFLSKPGDKFEAEVTASGKQVIKIRNSEMQQSITRYPSTGTEVITTVRKDRK